MITLRLVRPDESARLAALAEETFRDTFGAANTPANMDSYVTQCFSSECQLRELTNPTHRTFVAELGDEWLGYYMLVEGSPPATARRTNSGAGVVGMMSSQPPELARPTPAHFGAEAVDAVEAAPIRVEEPAIEISRFYVLAKHHGSRLAHTMMKHIIDTTRADGFKTLWLGVWEENPRAIAFYKKWIFKPIGEKTFMLGNDPQRDLILSHGL